LLVHGEAAQLDSSALDQFLRIDLEAVVLEEWTRGQTRFGEDPANTSGTKGRLDALQKARRNTPASEIGMREKKVEMTVILVGTKANENIVVLSNDSVEWSESLAPIGPIWNGRPSPG